MAQKCDKATINFQLFIHWLKLQDVLKNQINYLVEETSRLGSALENQVRIGNIDSDIIRHVMEQLDQNPTAPINADPRVVQICKQMQDFYKKRECQKNVKNKVDKILTDYGFSQFMK